MFRWLLLAASIVGTFAVASSLDRHERGLLWRVVQGCVLAHEIAGSPFPCLAVETPDGIDRGYAVLRSPLDSAHVIVTPTVRTIGIEAPQLRGREAPNYFEDAWLARRFVLRANGRAPSRDDLALAVNSRFGRSQDQLHIHVDCVRGDVKRTLAQATQAIRDAGWQRLKILAGAPHYWTHFLAGEDLRDVNLFDEVATALAMPPEALDEVTIVVVASQVPRGFYVLARKRLPHSSDEAHGEALLDHDCGDPR